MYWIPRPPSAFGFVTLCQPTQCTFLASSVDPHKKFLFTLSRLASNFFGSAVLCITYTGIVVVDAWMRTTLPAKDKRFTFQPANFCLTLSKMKLRSSLLAPRCFIGNPRYLPRLGVE
ncbi:hypothetical protein ACB092_07G193200 [Castanea dentata]